MLTAALVGGLFGASFALLVLFLLLRGPSSLDTVPVPPEVDVVPQLRAWAEQHGYKQHQLPDRMRFQKGSGLVKVPRIVDLSQPGPEQQISAFVEVSMFGYRRTIALTAPGGTAKAPRREALREFNELLSSLGRPMLAA
ncbi:hypothetical protein [Skermania piniformis]|uniref:DUF1499 domain-containing protein n=1 Tax=Skermania pinensis TaxID=39122 RepID=A0ABX8S8Y3_9ACTN|nr:hypothetical protein [Skermania piniformis]QXQ14233.1 hypothetical protein KV203_02010 [Skermania piniformis]